MMLRRLLQTVQTLKSKVSILLLMDDAPEVNGEQNITGDRVSILLLMDDAPEDPNGKRNGKD